MSQRLIKPGLRHPHTGELVRAIGYRRNGTPIWPVLGASPDDEGDGGGDGGDEDGGDDEGDGDEDGADDDTSDDSKGKSGKKDDAEETIEKWKYDKLHNRMTAADKRSSELQKAIDELKANGKVDEAVRKELDELKAKAGPLEAERDQLRMHVAFLTSNTIKWKDAEAALKLADLSEVEFDDKGRIDKRALKSALNDLAKAKPWLVDTDGTKDTGSDTDNGGTATKVGTAAKNGRRKGEKETSGREALAKRFPVLNR